jgi:hypothetical protein
MRADVPADDEVRRPRTAVLVHEPGVQACPAAEPLVDEHARDVRSHPAALGVVAIGEPEHPAREPGGACLRVGELGTELDDPARLGQPDLARHGRKHQPRVAGRVTVDVLVVVQAPQARSAGRPPQERPQVLPQVRRVEQIGGQHAEMAATAQAAEHAVVANREAWRAEGRLGDVIDLVPRGVGADPRVDVVEPADRPAVRAGARRPAHTRARVAAAVEAPTVRAERDQHPLPACARRGHECRHLGLAAGSRPVPGHDVADLVESQAHPRRAAEHRRVLLAHPDAVGGAGGAGYRQGDGHRREHHTERPGHLGSMRPPARLLRKPAESGSGRPPAIAHDR